jgi:hypothetical protein
MATGMAIPLSKLFELALGNGHFARLLLREVWRLEFLPLLQGALIVLLLVVEAGVVLPVEKFDVA